MVIFPFFFCLLLIFFLLMGIHALLDEFALDSSLQGSRTGEKTALLGTLNPTVWKDQYKSVPD